MKTKMLYLLVLIMLLQGCSSVTMRPYGGEKDRQPADYSVSKTFWWWGIKGEHEINTSEICGNRRVMQMQTVLTVSDILRGIVTLFIYSPRTAKVWCEPAESQAMVGAEHV